MRTFTFAVGEQKNEGTYIFYCTRHKNQAIRNVRRIQFNSKCREYIIIK